MFRHYLPLLAVLTIAPALSAADEWIPVVVDFAPLAKVKGKYGFDYEFYCLDQEANDQQKKNSLVTGFAGSTWIDPSEEDVKSIRDKFQKKCEDSGYDVVADGDTKLILLRYQGMPLQTERIKFKVRLWDDKTQKGNFEPTVGEYKKKK